VKSARIRLVSLSVFSLSALMVLAVPAGASTGGASTGIVLANTKFKWFYWIGFILAVSLVLWLLATFVGYYMRVLRPKWRGRQSS
jgi:thiosulfate reductase cytochrome b subunit